MQSPTDAHRLSNILLQKNIGLKQALTLAETENKMLYGMMYDLKNITLAAESPTDYLSLMKTFFASHSNLDSYVAFSADVNYS